jgi:hypothetical protein
MNLGVNKNSKLENVLGPMLKSPTAFLHQGYPPYEAKKTNPFITINIKFIAMKRIRVYYANICDHKGKPVFSTKVYASNRQAAAVALNLIDKIPPAMSFSIHFREVTTKEIAELLNGVQHFFS